MIVCEGQKFCYGNIDCTNGCGNVQLYQNLFCREELLNTGKDCAKDSAPVTKRCYTQLIAPDEPAVPEIFEYINKDSEKYEESRPLIDSDP